MLSVLFVSSVSSRLRPLSLTLNESCSGVNALISPQKKRFKGLIKFEWNTGGNSGTRLSETSKDSVA